MTDVERVTKKLEGTLKVFTCFVMFRDGTSVEIQSDDYFSRSYDNDLRENLLVLKESYHEIFTCMIKDVLYYNQVKN